MVKWVFGMKLNKAICLRITELLEQRHMTQYQLFKASGVPKATISNIMKCAYDSVKLRIIHEICQGFQIDIIEFFNSPLFKEENLEP